jgi:hypothetical protein
MSYKHVLTSTLKAPTDRDLHNDPACADWPFKLDGIPVRREVYELGNELRRSYHGFRFHATRGDNSIMQVVKDGDDTPKKFYTDVTVYIEGSDYVVGVIGHGRKYGIKEVDKSVYMINSRKIQNEKFAEHRDQYFMSFVNDHKKAVRLALSKLVPYSPKEMANISIYDFKQHIEGVRADVQRGVSSLVSPLSDRNILMREMRNLIAQNTMFVTEEFQRAAAGFIKAEEEWNEVRNKPVHGYYVYVRMVGDEQWVDIVEATDAQKYRSVDHCPVTSTPVSDVPEDIQGKVAVLSMADIGQYMQGVGVRTTEKSFWLERT